MIEPSPRWPRPGYDPGRQPHMFFLVTPPFAGSTAIAALLSTSPRTMLLQERGEGQWLVPGLCEGDRWDADKEIDYESVRAVWLAAWQARREALPLVDVVIEKSPPNMVRLEKLAALFTGCSFLANNRDPYANCASILYRVHDGENLRGAERKEQLQILARHWLLRSRCIRQLIKRLNIPLLTYEQFCEDPSLIQDRLQLPEGVAESIDVSASVKVKDYPLQGIVNQNERQLGMLSRADIAALSEILREDPGLLDYFGYELW